jgi:hypothetical protein
LTLFFLSPPMSSSFLGIAESSPLQIHKFSRMKRSKNNAKNPTQRPQVLRINTDDRPAIPMLPLSGFAHEPRSSNSKPQHPATKIHSS